MELTKAEEQVMQILWKLEKAFVKEIIEEFNEPKPAYNTISTIIRILEKKNFVSHNSFGKTYQYYPLIAKDEYKKNSLSKMIKGYFNNSYKSLVSFFSKNEDLSLEEMEEIKRILDERINNLKQKK